MRCQSFAKNVNNFYCILSSCSASSSISLRMSRAAITTWCSSSSLTTVLEHGPALGELDLRLRCSRFVIRHQEISGNLNSGGPDIVVVIIQKIGDFIITLSQEWVKCRFTSHTTLMSLRTTRAHFFSRPQIHSRLKQL